MPPGTSGNDETGIPANAEVRHSCKEYGNFFFDWIASKYASQLGSLELVSGGAISKSRKAYSPLITIKECWIRVKYTTSKS